MYYKNSSRFRILFLNSRYRYFTSFKITNKWFPSLIVDIYFISELELPRF